MAGQGNVATMQRFVAAVLGGDMDTVKALCDPEMELQQGSSLPYAGTFAGAEGFVQFLGVFGETYDIERLEPVRSYVADDPNYVIGEIEMVATVKASGKRFVSSLLEQWQFRDGKVLTIKPHYFNSPLVG
jgi:ketosteroid isomerase-like protein